MATSEPIQTPSTAPSASTPAPTTNNPNSTFQPFHTNSLYVGDIHPEVTEALLFEIFNAVGPVASIRVCRDAVTRRSLGYAYVNFHNVADAERALDTMNYTSIKGVPCRIMWSQRDPSLRKSGVGNIFVKNLSTDVDNKALYDTFSLFGNILSCKVVNEPNGDSKGYGYVHYETQEAAEEAIEKINGMLIAGQEVFVGQFQKRQERGDEAVFTNCFVKNIPPHWTDVELRAEFQPFGAITSCVIMPAKDKPAVDESPSEDSSSKPKSLTSGFGFVNYENPEAAAAAVEALNGRTFPSADESTDIELYVGKAQKKSDRARELRSKFDALKAERISKYQGVNLYVKNLDDAMTEEELREAFAVYGNITSARIMRDPTSGNSRGFGFVCFSTPEESTKAVTDMNGKLLRGKPVYVALAQRKEVRRAQLEAQHAQRQAGFALGQRSGGAPLPGMYGGPATAPPMFYAQPNRSGAQQGQSGGFMYPPMMMAAGGQFRGPPRGMPSMGYGNGRGGPGVPMYMNNGGQMGPQGRRQGHGRRNSQRGNQSMGPRGNYPPPGPVSVPNPQQQNSSFKYTANARNQPQSDQYGLQDQATVPNQQNPQGPQGLPQAAIPLTPAALANASPELQKNMIGERLYPLIHAEQPALAGKITGMLLEMDNGELLHLLESPEALTSKISEAIQVLEQHSNSAEASAE